MWSNCATVVRRFLREEEGANGVEYALLAGLIAIVFVVGASALGTSINNFLNTVATCVSDTATCPGVTPPAG